MLMAYDSRRGASHDYSRVSRKAEEAVLRRYQAVHWLECVVGPLGIHTEPTETEFISCLRNGIILCNAINKIQPGIIPKVVDNYLPLESESNVWDSRPLPAYQYFENVRNFLLAVAHLKLPAFEASDLERENIEAGSAARIADCILALKSYHEWKEWSGGNGVYKHVTVKSPLVMHPASEKFSRSVHAEAVQPCRQLDFPPRSDKESLTELIVKALSQDMVDSKENLNANLLTSLKKGNQQDPVQIFSEILSGCLEEKLRNRSSQLNTQEITGNASASHPQPISILQENLSSKTNSENCQTRKSSSDHWRILNNQKKDLTDIKALWTETKNEFEYLRNHLMKDLNDLGILVEEMSNHARGYQKVIQENRKLYNMVQDLKGNIRVCCRIRPMFNSEARNVASFQAEDGTIVVIDPTKLRSEDGKEYQFTRVYGPIATQDELYKDAQPLIRSVMDGYNVCILAYGQTGSGKSYTMYGSSGVSEKEMGLTFFALNDLFQTANMRKYTITYELHIQMVEICNEQVRDLLSEGSTQHDESSLSNVALQAVTKNTEAINLVKQGQIRCTGPDASEKTNLSNCSHSVVTIHVQGKDLSGKIFRSRLHLVDLAQSGEDDKSLSCLEDVIASSTQKKSYIHYKDSKLTSLLQDALERDSFTKTVSTLKFAQRISTIELGTAQSNKMNSEVMELKNEVKAHHFYPSLFLLSSTGA
ncbi:hypothetical protein KSS87_012929 [Heliosperma pusillum]|nr:hypothetical protein KSS87_012929 [Heliosperma pusillum]